MVDQIHKGDGTLQRRIAAGKCPKCKAAMNRIWCESQDFTGWYFKCGTCRIEVVDRKIDKASDAML